MWYLATCDANGRAFGFLRKDRTVSTDPDNELEQLMTFKKKYETNEICAQINLSNALFPDGMKYGFRVVPVKG